MDADQPFIALTPFRMAVPVEGYWRVTFSNPPINDPVSGLKIELSRSDDSHVHFRHVGVCAEDVDGAHESLVTAGSRGPAPVVS